MTDYGDAYYTPPKLTRALLEQWNPAPMRIAEPCAGHGWISRELEAAGHELVAGDVDKSAPLEHPGLDFFSKRALEVYADVDAIVTNPPYSAAARFVRRAREIAPLVVMLLRVSFLEPCVKEEMSRRADLVQDLSHFIVTPRVSFHRGGDNTDSVTTAWFFWSRGQEGARSFGVITETDLARHAGQGELFTHPAAVLQDAALAAQRDKQALGVQSDMFAGERQGAA